MVGIAVAFTLATAGDAKWTEQVTGARVAVAKSNMVVVAPARWNQSSARPSKKSEMWSFDGPLLNRIDFYAGVVTGEALLKERNKKRNPLPKFQSNMQPSDVADLFERTARVTEGTADFAVDTVAPANFAGRKGFRFSYHYTTDETLGRKGIAAGAVIDGKLYLITYSAPQLQYFDAGLRDAEAVMDSASIG